MLISTIKNHTTTLSFISCHPDYILNKLTTQIQLVIWSLFDQIRISFPKNLWITSAYSCEQRKEGLSCQLFLIRCNQLFSFLINNIIICLLKIKLTYPQLFLRLLILYLLIINMRIKLMPC